jgi:hypothetical protein
MYAIEGEYVCGMGRKQNHMGLGRLGLDEKLKAQWKK